MRHTFTLLSVFTLTCSLLAQDVVIMPDSTNNRLVHFSPVDGSVICSNVFALASGTTVHAMPVGDEIWVSEQIGDRVSRWSRDGTFLGQIGPTGLDNIRGMGLINGKVYVTNAGTANGAPGGAIVMFGTNGTPMGFFATPNANSPFGVLDHQGAMLVSSSNANDDIHRYSYTGTPLGTFHNSTSLNFAEQMAYAADGHVLVAGFSSNNVVKLDVNSGTVLSSFTASGARGVFQLRNGNILWTNASGAHVYNPATNTSTQVYTGGGRYLELMSFSNPIPGDVNGDDCVDDLDLLIVLFNFGTYNDPRADLNRDGSIDDIDLLIVLFHFGECRPNITWKLNFESLHPSSTVIVQTTQGARVTQIDGGAMELKMGETTCNGQIPIEIVAMSLSAQGVQINPTLPTGGIAFLQDLDASSSGMWDPNTGQFTLMVPMRMTYWLLNELYPIGRRGELDDDVEATFAQCIATLNGQAFLTGPNNDILHFDGVLNIQVTELEFTGPVLSVDCQIAGEFKKKEPLEACPTKTTNKRKICIQPVFIGTGPNDANATGASYAAFKAQAEAIWGKACIEFQWQTPIYINNNAYKILEGMGDDLTAEERALLREVDEKGDNDCIEVFFVSRMQNANGQKHESGDGYTVGSGGKQTKIVVADDAVTDCDPDSDRVLAHELGHALGDLPHDADTCMKPTGNPPNCPGLNPNKVTTAQAKKLTNPLIKEKDPKERCCLTTSD